MSEELRSILLGTAGLSVAGIAALCLTLARERSGANDPELRAAARLAAVAVIVQSAHFIEEVSTGFHHRFPELLGLAPWPLSFFVVFNLVWLLIWSASVWGVTARLPSALFALWFLSLASTANGVAHPLFALGVGGYFPGLVSAPVIGVLGVLLFRCLLRITRRDVPPFRRA
jgi:hypothetical protein